ncbi:TrbI/VirB10 family protein [Sulfurospirillum arcachonense]|uniref:TrbI/VirB10 family protein n=1 Tax=Sulfurospirillum arcachonense TaxID=57666 RepID=UPI000469C703|nr:TrbI/VirB10 family protein [Sulfurospirillum arcachonense]
MKNKKLLNFFVIISIPLLMIGSLFLYAYLSLDEENKINNFQSENNTKFPVDAYMLLPEKKHAPYKEKKVEKKEEKKDIKMKIDTIQEDLNKKKEIFDLNIFESQEEIKTKELEKQRKIILASRIQRTDENMPPKNSFIKPKKEKDFGDGKFSNYSTQDNSSYQTKLYRTITADKMIPAILTNSIHSTLSGKVVAQIEEDIYSSMGDTLLIPKGSKAIGFYKNDNKIGENRFMLMWQRILTPFGHNILLTKAQSADILGNSGIVGVMDERYWERYGLPLSLSTLSNSVLLLLSNATGNGSDGNNNNTQVILNNSREDIGYIMRKIIDEQTTINPLITVDSGSRIFINPTVDIWFPKPKNGEILAKYFHEKQIPKKGAE